MADGVVVIEPMGVGGITHYTYCLCQALAARGLKTTLITTKNYELAERPREFRLYPVLREWFQPEVSPVAHRVVRRSSQLEVLRRRLGSARLMLRIVNIVLREKASIVHIQWPVGPHDWLYLAALRLLGRRIVYTAHDVLPPEHTVEDGVRLRRLLRHVDRVIVHAHDNDSAFHRIFRDVAPFSHVVPHGNYFFFDGLAATSRARARAAVGVPLESRVVLFFGMIRPYKGLGDLIRAFSRVRAQIPAAWLLIAGYPLEEFTPYQEAIAAANVRECAALHLGYHPMPEVGKFFRAADLVVLPYRSASQSGIAQLAFAFGLPVVATRVGGLPEVVQNERTGLLVDPGDERGLAEAITRLLTDAPLSRSMSARATQQAATSYSWSHVADMTLDVYEAAQGNRRMRAPVTE